MSSSSSDGETARPPDDARWWLEQAVLLRKQQKYLEALDAGEKALECCRAIGRAKGKRAAQALSENGYAYRVLKNFSEAEAALTRALEMTRELYPGDHPAVMEGLDRLALLRKDQGRYDEAEVLSVSALDLCVKKFGEDHEFSGQLKHNLAVIRERGRAGMAMPADISQPVPSNGHGPASASQRSEKKGMFGQIVSRFF